MNISILQHKWSGEIIYIEESPNKHTINSIQCKLLDILPNIEKVDGYIKNEFCLAVAMLIGLKHNLIDIGYVLDKFDSYNLFPNRIQEAFLGEYKLI